MAWDNTVVAPSVGGDLSGVAATVHTMRGPLSVRWNAGTQPICAIGHEKDDVCIQPAVVDCGSAGGVIDTISFASYGVPLVRV